MSQAGRHGGSDVDSAVKRYARRRGYQARVARMTDADLDALAGRLQSPDGLRSILAEDLKSALADIAAAEPVIPYQDEYGRELDERLRELARRQQWQFMNEQLQQGSASYLTAVRAELAALRHREAGGRDAGRSLGAPDFVDAAVQVAIWVALSVGSGTLGNAAYDQLKGLTEGYRSRREVEKREKEAEALAKTGRRWVIEPTLPMQVDEAKSFAYLAICAQMRKGPPVDLPDERGPFSGSVVNVPALADLEFIRQRLIEGCERHPAHLLTGGSIPGQNCTCSENAWYFVVGVGELLARVRVPHDDPLKATVILSWLWS